MKGLLRGASLSLVMLFLSIPALWAATLVVPDDYPTLQGVIDAASDGDLCLVYPGTYAENIDFMGKAIRLQGVSGADVTIIDGNQAGSVVSFISGEGDASVLEGFTVRNGRDERGGGIRCYGSSPTIMSSVVEANTARRGGGIFLRYSSPTIMNSRIADNHTESTLDGRWSGGGIFCIFFSYPLILNCTIEGNSAQTHGGGIFSNYSNPEIQNCTIRGNSAIYNGGGVYYKNTPQAKLRNCLIEGNMAGFIGGGVYHRFGSSLIKNCTIVDNRAYEGGGISYQESVDSQLIHNTLAGNVASYSGGILCKSTWLRVTNTILWENTAPGGTEITAAALSSVSVQYSDVRDGELGIAVEGTAVVDWGDGNMDMEPLFVGPGDYHLSASSPCIDAGTIGGIYDDIDGEERPYGAGFDMGSDEYRP